MSRQREQELAQSHQAALGKLKGLLTPQEMRTVRKVGSAEPHTFWDSARELAKHPTEHDDYPRCCLVRTALRMAELTRNNFWTYLIERGVPDVLMSTWRRKHKGKRWVDSDDLYAETVFLLAHFIDRFAPEYPGDFVAYSTRGIHQLLTLKVAQMGPVTLPEKAARKSGAEYMKVSLDDTGKEPDPAPRYDSELQKRLVSDSPEDMLIAFIDGEIKEDEL